MEFDLKEFEKERKNINKWSLITLILSILVLVSGLALIFLYEILFVFFIGLIALFVSLGVFSLKKKKFSLKIKEKIILKLVKNELGDDAIYNPRGGISLNDILKPQVYQYPDRYNLEDYIKASYNGVNYEMCDARFEERHVTRDAKGNRTVHYIKYFSGRVIIVDFKKNIDVLMKIIEGQPKGLYTKGLDKIETEVIDFNKNFDTYINKKENAFYYLTPLFIQKILELKRIYKGTIQYVLNNNCFYIFINNSTDSLEFKVSKKIDEKAISIIKSQITIGQAIINEFNFDSSKYN